MGQCEGAGLVRWLQLGLRVTAEAATHSKPVHYTIKDVVLVPFAASILDY